MKAMLTYKALASTLALTSLLFTSYAFADDSTQTPRLADKTFNGTVTSVNQKEGTLSVKHLLFTDKFNVADNCKVMFENQNMTRWTDLRPGQQVKVSYQDAQGVLVAREISQHYENYDGYITAIDPGSRALIVKDGMFSKTFAVGENCAVSVNDKSGDLNQLKIGQTINVGYETVNGMNIVRSIDQPDATFTGTIQAIDTKARTISASYLKSDKKFNLAEDCRIVVAGKANHDLDDLHVGDQVAFTYSDNGGVLVANRIGLVGTDNKAEHAENNQASAMR